MLAATSTVRSSLTRPTCSVRYLDNFSAGTRGATSAEYFLSSGYAVIFLHRTHSLRPFSRHYSHSMNPFLDLLTVEPTSSGGERIQVVPQQESKLVPILKAYHQAHDDGTILSVNFQTVNDYLWLLRAAAGVMAPLGRRCMYYLAAAVSDFFLPDDRVVSNPEGLARRSHSSNSSSPLFLRQSTRSNPPTAP